MNSHFDTARYDPSRDADFWSDAPPAAAATAPTGAHGPARTSPGRKAADPLDKLRRLLRGRTTLAIVLAVVGALLGAALGYVSQQPVYEAGGSAYIPPAVPTLVSGENGNPNYRFFMQTEATYAEGEAMAEEAMKTDAWRAAADKPRRATDFAGPASVRATGGDNLLYFSFKSDKPEVALAGTQALMEAYRVHFLEQRGRATKYRLGLIEPELVQIRDDLDDVKEQVAPIVTRWGSEDLAPIREDLLKRRNAAAGELRQVRADLGQAVAARERALADPNFITNVEIGRFDEEMRAKLDARAEVQGRINMMLDSGKGMKSPLIRPLEQQLKYLDADIVKLGESLRARFFGTVPNLNPAFGDTMQRAVTADYIQTLEARSTTGQADFERLDQNVDKILADSGAMNVLLDRRRSLNETRDRLSGVANTESQNSDFQAALGTIKLYPPSKESVFISKDKRQPMALGGAILGFGIPVGLVLLLGTLDRRFRYSDDASDTATGAPLLGILPNLPDRLSDPNQASIAAHCVHQIRTMLQINHGSDEARAFAVTSAGRGDGKTSLALALGLSYAASGARTLLIDTDLQSGGLSRRLGVGGDEGVMDALAGGELLRFVCETDVTDLAILPIGRAAANHAGAFSPGAVRHLIDEAKRTYDVVVCDTGPTLGNIEATPVAAAMDGVLLTVSRGQSRTVVNKALRHLETVGATVAGMVFNRAQAGDFERSVSGMNLRGGEAARLAVKDAKTAKNGKSAKNGRANGTSKLTRVGQN